MSIKLTYLRTSICLVKPIFVILLSVESFLLQGAIPLPRGVLIALDMLSIIPVDRREYLHVLSSLLQLVEILDVLFVVENTFLLLQSLEDL